MRKTFEEVSSFQIRSHWRRLKKEIPTILWLRKVILLAAILLCSMFPVDYSWSELMWCPLKKEGSWTECHILNAISLIATSTILYLSCFSCELPLTQSARVFFSPSFLTFLTHTRCMSSLGLSTLRVSHFCFYYTFPYASSILCNRSKTKLTFHPHPQICPGWVHILSITTA